MIVAEWIAVLTAGDCDVKRSLKLLRAATLLSSYPHTNFLLKCPT